MEDLLSSPLTQTTFQILMEVIALLRWYYFIRKWDLLGHN